MTEENSPASTQDEDPQTAADDAGSWRDDLACAACFLTRLPFAGSKGSAANGQAIARATAWFPVVGAAVGGTGAILLLLADGLGLPASVASLVALAAMALLTGGLHEDGLADVADGLGGGRDRDTRLAIMRDSRIGTFGTLALVFVIGLEVGCLAALHAGHAAGALIAAGALSRAPLPVILLALDPARPDGLAAAVNRPGELRVYAAVGSAVLVAWLFIGFGATLIAAIVVTAGVWLLARAAQRTLGGHTGDVLGCVQKLAEVLVLATVVVM